MNEATKTIEDQITRLFEEMVSAFPAGCVDLRIKRAPEIRHGGVSVWLTPSELNAAQIVADAENGKSTLTVSLGRCTPIEVLPRRGRAMMDDVRELCDAVFHGKFEEDLWLVGPEVSKCIGRIAYGGRVHTFRYYGGFFPFRRKERKHIQYSPYFGG
jgi:hypothetical protein